jgi:hypothetical protein
MMAMITRTDLREDANSDEIQLEERNMDSSGLYDL